MRHLKCGTRCAASSIFDRGVTQLHIIQNIDADILLFVQDHLRCGFLNVVMICFSTIGTGGLIWIASSIVMIITKKHRHAGILLLICLAVCWVINDGLVKNLIQRPRPYITLTDLRVLVPLRTDFSFPSGHTSTSFAAAYAITRSNGRRWAWVYAVAALIAVSRIYVGMHYPTDVLCGILLGTCIAAITYSLAARYIFSRRNRKTINQ